ncbi:Oxidase ucsJ [Fulvia fulva]|uniref:Oxidase ucsJ n=1 Tax=Passalora fulva TaxID=5499 RepID=A0A9Q8LI93_PASFU|nr:Oxidase ucsJ [Fulvia fulva]KAK4624177.1 Oxidase ucsJ [Fulvia fulva]KAK4625690.1 Oxidase ucsJ [Fulvia fulva]UJO17974.1 Oxidase ucsJ [Fulvia fulva]WPV15586.1 Oxidase ucsJ [Fulvia fulva]WPV29879.1 Oxidase ucsJ [Fulvia fulva]
MWRLLPRPEAVTSCILDVLVDKQYTRAIVSNGYIGGDALYAIATAHPDWDITCLVRNSDKGAKVAKQYPQIKFVYGTLDDADLIEGEVKKADIVCNFANADHEVAANAIARGLAAHDPSLPGFLIHTSGTGILMFEDLRDKTFGTQFRDKVYDDLEGVADVTSLPDDAPHRTVDKIVLKVGTDHADRAKTAIVSPPTIYGPGRGPDNQRSHQLPELCRVTIERGHAIKVNEGKTYWTNIHVHDLSDLYLKLAEEAAAGGSTKEWPDKPATWGAEGYYFAENGEHVWREVSQWVATEAKKQNLASTDEVKSVSPEEAGKATASGQALSAKLSGAPPAVAEPSVAAYFSAGSRQVSALRTR